jgi:hypothetical protein
MTGVYKMSLEENDNTQVFWWSTPKENLIRTFNIDTASGLSREHDSR